MSLVTLINQTRNIKPRSLNSYIISLKKIHKFVDPDSDFDSLSWLDTKHYDKVVEFLDTLKLPTRKNYISAVLVALGTDKEKNEKLIEQYRNKLDLHSAEYNEAISSHQKSDKLEKNWATMAELRTIVNMYGKELKMKNIYNNEELSNKEFDLFQQYLVGSLYTMMPPVRNDYANMKVISFKDYDKLKDKKNNFLVIVGKNKKFFSFGAYKTEETFGVMTVPIRPAVNKILNDFLKHNTSGYLLLNKKREPLSDNGLTKLLNKTFSPTGKKISSTVIRHVYLSEKYADVEAEKEKDSAAMMHSMSTQQDYIKK